MATPILIPADSATAVDDLWGYVGVRVPGAAASKLYPICAAQAERISQQLSADAQWVAVSTLNNRALLVNAQAVPRLSVTDNLDLSDDPSAFCGAFAMDWDDGLSADDYAGLYGYLADGGRLTGPAAFTARILSIVQQHALDDGRLRGLLRVSRVHYRDGTRDELPLDAQAAWALFESVQHAAERVLNLACLGRGLDVFVPADQVALVDLPLHPMRQAARAHTAEYEAEAQALAAIGRMRRVA
jgi:hypothetical protein